MKLKIRTTLIAGAVATLLAGPAWAASDTPKDGAYAPAPTKAEMGQPERDQTTAGQADVTPRMGGADHGTTARSGDAAAIDKPTGISNAAERSAAGSMAAGSTTTAGTSVGDNPLYSRSADDLDGMEVVDSTGDKIGDVKQIVLAPDRKSAHAVISAGGFLGMGARDIMVSLDELKPMDDKLQLNVTKDEIASLKDAEPDADKYAEVKGDTPISGSIVEFSAFEKGKEPVKPEAAPMTPKTDAYKPAATPETPKAPQ
ncbi:MAG TPA: PRC-barrel domain-containing protein [Azoarcus taiwanensis]|nr:PRC-barrel domain-containing protein [Azoarcus taiwanensis]